MYTELALNHLNHKELGAKEEHHNDLANKNMIIQVPNVQIPITHKQTTHIPIN